MTEVTALMVILSLAVNLNHEASSQYILTSVSAILYLGHMMFGFYVSRGFSRVS